MKITCFFIEQTISFNTLDRHMNNSVKHSLKGRVTWKVVRDGKVVRQEGPYDNMILNSGLNYVATYPFADCFKYCAVGTSKSIVLATQTGLFEEVARTSNLSTDTTSNGSTLLSNVLTLKRTFVFPTSGSTITYKELGFSPIGTAGANLFSRAMFRNSLGYLTPATIEAGDSLLVEYELSIQILSTSVVVTTGITSTPSSSGVVKFQKVGLKGVSNLGVTEDFDDTAACNEPSVIANAFLSASSTAPAAVGSCIDRSPSLASKALTLGTYVTNSYQQTKSADFRPWERPTTWRSVGVGSAASHGVVFVFDNNQSPMSSIGYVTTFTYTWAYVPGAPFPSASSDYPIHWLSGEDYCLMGARAFRNVAFSYFAL
jgi:hypothetical protein